MHIKELFFTNSYISKEKWNKFITTISKFNGYFNQWTIIIQNDNKNIRYFLKNSITVPSTINNLTDIYIKESNLKTVKSSFGYPMLFDISFSILDIINILEIKSKILEYIEINIFPLTKTKYITKNYIYIKHKNKIKKHKLLFSLPANILSIDFSTNQRFLYKKLPKYLDINKILYTLTTNTSNALLQIDTFPFFQDNYYLNQTNFDFDKHSLILGSSGSGKSKFISSFINNLYKSADLNLKYKIIVIDPHAALENDIGLISKIIDFNCSEDSFNLFNSEKNDITIRVELLLDLFKSLMSNQYNSRLERMLRYSLYVLLTDNNFNFQSLRKLLTDLEFRTNLINKLKQNLSDSIIEFFLCDFNDLKTKYYGETISPIITFLDEMEMLPAFRQTNNNTLKEIIKDNFITLISLNRIKLGDKGVKTISGLIFEQLFTLIQSNSFDEHIIFIIDEVPVVENPILTKYLSEARKYNLSLILIGQFFNQISSDLKNSIFANVINYYIFRISKLDASSIVENINIKIPLDDRTETKVKLLTELKNRECVARISNNGILLPAFKGTTLNFDSLPRVKKDKIIETQKNSSKENKTTNLTFKVNSTINLKDILIKNSSSKKEINYE